MGGCALANCMEPLSRASVEGVASLDLEDESVARRAGVASINLRQCGVSLRTQAQFNCMPLSKQVCLSLFVPCYSSHLVPPSFLPHYRSLHADVRVGCYIPCHQAPPRAVGLYVPAFELNSSTHTRATQPRATLTPNFYISRLSS